MPTLLTTILAAFALFGVLFTLLRNSRRAALIVDFILVGSLVEAHLPPLSPTTSAGPLDIAVLILILSFHEFSSIYSDTKRYELSYPPNGGDEDSSSDGSEVREALIHRSISAAGLFAAAAIVSEAYFLAAQGISASLYSIYGVAAGLMAVIVFLFLFLTIAPKTEKPS